MGQFILGIDAGGTKTEGLLRCQITGTSWTFKSGPGSLTNDFSAACENIKEVARQLLLSGDCDTKDTILVCGAAGANTDLAKTRLIKDLEAMNFKQLVVTTDAQTSLYGAGNGEPIIVVALGTGSVAMRLDERGQQKQFGGWGFAAGDLGSGADIGRELVRSILNKFDEDEFVPDELTAEVLKIIGDDQQSILNWLNNVTPSKFAALTPLVSNSINQSNLAKTILQKAATEIERLICAAQTKENLSVCIIGGLAAVIIPMLSSEMRAQIVPAKGSAIDGALYLAELLGEQTNG